MFKHHILIIIIYVITRDHIYMYMQMYMHTYHRLIIFVGPTSLVLSNGDLVGDVDRKRPVL